MMISGRAAALPGIAGIRWQTTFDVVGGGSGTADLVVDDAQNGEIFPPGSLDSDGTLAIASYVLSPVDGLVESFKGAWSRGGDGGNFFFDVVYINGQAARMVGAYNSPETGPVMLQWSAVQ
jgi:hypothetical protein